MITLPFSEAQVYSFFFVLLRVTGILFFLPLLGDRTIPVSVKAMFGLAITFIAFPLLWNQGMNLDPKIFDSPLRLILAIVVETSFGMLLGFASRWIFDAVHTCGNFIGVTMGFSIATVLDPHSETQTVAIAELQYIMAALLLLAIDGHHLFLMSIMHSFKVLPVTTINFLSHSNGVIQYLIQMTAEVLTLGLKLSAPIMVVILISNLGFSILARAVSQMNVLVITFTANVMIGLVIVLISLTGFMNLVNNAFESYMPEIIRFMRLFGG